MTPEVANLIRAGVAPWLTHGDKRTDGTREESGVQKHPGSTTVMRSKNPFLSGPNAGDLEEAR